MKKYLEFRTGCNSEAEFRVEARRTMTKYEIMLNKKLWSEDRAKSHILVQLDFWLEVHLAVDEKVEGLKKQLDELKRLARFQDYLPNLPDQLQDACERLESRLKNEVNKMTNQVRDKFIAELFHEISEIYQQKKKNLNTGNAGVDVSKALDKSLHQIIEYYFRFAEDEEIDKADRRRAMALLPLKIKDLKASQPSHLAAQHIGKIFELSASSVRKIYDYTRKNTEFYHEREKLKRGRLPGRMPKSF